MKTQTFVENKPGENQRMLPGKEGDGYENKIGQRANNEDLKMASLPRTPKHKDRYVKKRKRNNIFARDDAPELWVKWIAQGTGDCEAG
jgi:hypothetical protein